MVIITILKQIFSSIYHHMNIILTGGHTGIGFELTKRLMHEGHHLGLIIRSEKRKQEVIEHLGAGEQLDFFYADLSVQQDVVRVAKEIQAKWDQVDILFNNAGVLLDGLYTSAQGNEMHYEVNTLAPYLLTLHLKPLLDASTNPKVVTTVTGSMHSRKEFDIDGLLKPKKFVKLFGSYLQSKVGATVLMNDLAKQWPHISFANVNPGPNKTNMTGNKESMPGLLLIFRNLFFPGPEKGGAYLYHAAFKPEFQGQSGIFIDEKKVKPMQYALDEASRAHLLSGLVESTTAPA